jgi:acid-sensing ion channel, other
VYDQCDCVPFYFPRNESMTICDIKKLHCSSPMKNKLIDDFDRLYATEGVCKCLPACNMITYDIEIEYSRYDWDDVDLWYETEIIFRFRESEYFPLIRYQEFTFSNMASAVGGILGLFAGISVLSIFETFYFLTFRLVSHFRAGQ